MSELRKVINVTDSSGETIAIDRKFYRREAILRNDGPNRVWFAFNEEAVSNIGIYFDAGEVLNLSMLKGKGDLYLICSSGEAATVYAQL